MFSLTGFRSVSGKLFPASLSSIDAAPVMTAGALSFCLAQGKEDGRSPLWALFSPGQGYGSETTARSAAGVSSKSSGPPVPSPAVRNDPHGRVGGMSPFGGKEYMIMAPRKSRGHFSVLAEHYWDGAAFYI